MLKKLLIGFGAVLFALVAFIAMQPAEYSVSRNTTMNAAPDLVYAAIANFRRWEEWSPWAKLDPAMTKTFEGAEMGTGAIHGWSGNDQVGEGRMTITAVKENQQIDIGLEFMRPWKSQSVTTFSLVEAGEGTQVTWTMTGQNDFMGKALSLFSDMDKMVGPDFEKGLASLKTVTEADMKKRIEEAARVVAEGTPTPVDGETDAEVAAPNAEPTAAPSAEAAPDAAAAPTTP